jgi:hypothetical protein
MSQKEAFIMKRFVLTTLFSLALIFVHSQASAILKLEGRYWFTDLDGDLKVTESGIEGTDIELTDTLKVDDEDFWEIRATLELGRHKIRYGFVQFEWDGENTLTETITFGGETFTITTFVATDLDIDYHRLGYEYDIIDTLDNRLGLIVEVKYFDIDASLEAPNEVPPIKESEAFAAPIPTVGVAFQLGLPFLFNVGGELTGITLGKYGYLLDGEAAVNFKPFPFVSISGGYRYLKLKAEDEDDFEVDIDLNGPFITLRAGF